MALVKKDIYIEGSSDNKTLIPTLSLYMAAEKLKIPIALLLFFKHNVLL